MKPVILAEKPSQAKAYADAFSVRKHEGFLEITPCPILPEGAYITWGVGHLVETGLDYPLAPEVRFGHSA